MEARFGVAHSGESQSHYVIIGELMLGAARANHSKSRDDKSDNWGHPISGMAPLRLGSGLDLGRCTE